MRIKKTPLFISVLLFSAAIAPNTGWGNGHVDDQNGIAACFDLFLDKALDFFFSPKNKTLSKVKSDIRLGSATHLDLRRQNEGLIRIRSKTEGLYSAVLQKETTKPVGEDALVVWNGDGRTVLFSIDGIGGHGGGEVASQAVAETVADIVKNGVSLDEAIEACPQAMDREFREKRGSKDMGVVAVGVEIEKDRVHFSHFGDSKAIQVRKKKIVHETRDHSEVQKLVDAGELDPVLAMHVPFRNIVNRGMNKNGIFGLSKSEAVVEKAASDIVSGDWLVLASDGLWDNLMPSEVAEIVSKSTDVDRAVVALYEALREVDEKGSYRRREQRFKSDDLNIIVYRHP